MFECFVCGRGGASDHRTLGSFAVSPFVTIDGDAIGPLGSLAGERLVKKQARGLLLRVSRDDVMPPWPFIEEREEAIKISRVVGLADMSCV